VVEGRVRVRVMKGMVRVDGDGVDGDGVDGGGVGLNPSHQRQKRLSIRTTRASPAWPDQTPVCNRVP